MQAQVLEAALSAFKDGRQNVRAVAARWLPNGASGIETMLRRINRAVFSIQLQTYIFRDDATGRRLRDALLVAAERGVRVRLLLDALGSISLPVEFFAELRRLGAEERLFNPLHPRRFIYRNHRKLLVCDRVFAVVGGFNIGDEYAGDGIAHGWMDLGLELRGPLAADLAQAFDRMFVLSDAHPRRFARFYRAGERRRLRSGDGELLLGGPGRGPNPLKQVLLRELGRAARVRIVSPYFLPTWSLRRRLIRLARRGAQVQLLLPEQSDVALAQLAAQSLYGRLLRAGVEIHVYRPQVLHAKLVVTDRCVLVGSANFNTRSLHIDYELMLKFEQGELVDQAHGLVDVMLEQALTVDPEQWRRRRGWWRRLRERMAYWIVARLDPLVAGWLWRGGD